MADYTNAFPITELATAIAQQLQPFIEANKTQITTPLEVYKTRKETAQLLSISLPTLNEYTKRKLINGYRFGARVLYKQSEIEKALAKMDFGK